MQQENFRPDKQKILQLKALMGKSSLPGPHWLVKRAPEPQFFRLQKGTKRAPE